MEDRNNFSLECLDNTNECQEQLSSDQTDQQIEEIQISNSNSMENQSIEVFENSNQEDTHLINEEENVMLSSNVDIPTANETIDNSEKDDENEIMKESNDGEIEISVENDEKSQVTEEQLVIAQEVPQIEVSQEVVSQEVTHEEVAQEEVSQEVPQEVAQEEVSQEVPQEEVAQEEVSQEVPQEVAQEEVSQEVPQEEVAQEVTQEATPEVAQEILDEKAQHVEEAQIDNTDNIDTIEIANIIIDDELTSLNQSNDSDIERLIDELNQSSPDANDNSNASAEFDELIRKDIESEHETTETVSNPIPLPDGMSVSSNEGSMKDFSSDTSSVASGHTSEATAPPQETPLKRRSMIPVQSNRKIPLPREVFETPSIRQQSKGRIDPLFQSGLKPMRKPNNNLSTNNNKPKETTKIATRAHNKSNIRPKNSIKQTEQNTSQEEKDKSGLHRQAPKTITKKQLIEMTDRLAPITPGVNKQTKDNNKAHQETIKYAPQTPCCSSTSIFNKLFEMSTIKKKPLEEEQQEEKAKVVEVQPFISAKSNQLAYRRDIANICSVVGNVDECTRDNLDRIMKELKIIDATTTEEELKHVEKEYKHCLIGENVYSAKKLEAKLVDSVTLRRNRKFNVFVNGKLIIARANEKAAIEQHEEEPEPVKCSSTMQKETYERLLASKPAIVAEPETTQEPTTGLISRGSKFILQKSHRAQEISQMSLEERDHFLTKLRDETVHKLEVALKEEEEKEMHIKPHNLGALPQFYEQLPAEVKQRATPTKKVIEEQYKPKTTSYAEFLQKKDKIFNTETKVAGVEERVKRLRLARIERNELQEALDPRALPAELKNLKKKAHKKKAHKKPAPETKTEEIVEGCTDEIDDILGI